VPGVSRCELPQHALLREYLRDGAYADCYAVLTAGSVSHVAFVEAFYTTGLFRLERLLLGWFASRPSTDAEAAGLAAGTRDSFAAWRVESRGPDQLMLADVTGRTRSWLMVAEGEGGGTTLYFGSAVVPAGRRRTGQGTLGVAFRLLLGFHKLYARALLRAAKARLERSL
jgi:hypothetical protein